MSKCLVLPGLGGLAVQGLLLACCVGVFYVKRKREEFKLGTWARSREEFFLDASKQFASAGWIHVMNLGFAAILNDLMAGGDECEWYFINIMIDTTLGTLVAYFLLRIGNAFLRKRLGAAADDFKSGEYINEDGQINYKKYGKQLGLWLAVISCMKVLMVLCMFLFSGPLLGFAGFLLGPFLTQPWLKLLVVMILCPIVMDGFQIWMVDNFLKKPEKHAVNTAEGAFEEQDTELGTAYVERAADTLLHFSHRCEEATEEALLSLKVTCNQAMHPDEKQEHMEMAEKKSGLPTAANFDTQFNFQTRIPADQL